MNNKDKLEFYSRIIKDYQDIFNLMKNTSEDDYQERILTRINNEITKLKDFIKDMDFIDGRECYAYKVAKEKLYLLNYLKEGNHENN